MTHHPINEAKVFDYVRFDDNYTAVLGLNTNGCVPTRVYGLVVEGQIMEINDDVSETFWLKIATNPDFRQTAERNGSGVESRDVDFLAMGDADQIATILGTIVNASMVEDHDTVASQKFMSYFSECQRRADPQETTDVEIQDCTLRSKKTKGGFELCFSDDKEVISRLNATLDQNGIKAVLQLAADVREWHHFVANAIQSARESRAEEHLEAMAVAPGM